MRGPDGAAGDRMIRSSFACADASVLAAGGAVSATLTASIGTRNKGVWSMCFMFMIGCAVTGGGRMGGLVTGAGPECKWLAWGGAG